MKTRRISDHPLRPTRIFTTASLWLALALATITALPAATAPKLKPAGGFTATATSSTSIHLQWRDTNSAEKGYLIEVIGASGAYQRLTKLPKNSRSFDHQGLSPGTRYSYRIFAIWRKERSASRVASATTRVTPRQTVATAEFSPAAGTYTDSVQVSISTITADAEIRYSLDGSEPTSSSALYLGPVILTSTTSVKARAFKTGLTASGVASALYTITTAVATPTISPAAGTYTSSVQVSISTSTAGATIRYTTNGSDPNAGSPQYVGPINVTTTTTVKARAFKAGFLDSAIASAVFTITNAVATPVFSPAPMTFGNSMNVTISTNTAGATIRYTTDGSSPIATSTPYTGAISLTATTTLKARAFKAGLADSGVATATYTLAAAAAAPVFSPAAGTFTGSANVTLSSTTAGATIRYTTNGNDPTVASTVYTAAIPLTASTTIKARAFKAGLSDSPVATANYVIAVATPTFSPASGTFTGSVQVAIATTTSGATIRYTTDGSAPTASSALYTTPITAMSSTTFRAKAFKTGLADSAVSIGAYTITVPAPVATPVFSPAAGTFTDSVNVTISSATSGATIRYTTDGTAPTTASAIYTAAIPLTKTTTLKTQAFKSGSGDSGTATAIYTIVSSATRPGFSARPESTTAFNNASIRLNWLNIAGNQASGMTIERSSTGATGTYAAVTNATAGATTYVNTGLQAGRLYYYRARVTNSTGAWSYTSAVTNPTSTSNVAGPPSNLQVTAIAPPSGQTPEVLKIRWTRGANDLSYVIEQSDDGIEFHTIADLALEFLFPDGATNFFVYDAELPQNQTNYYRVRTKASSSISAPTDIVSATTRSTGGPSTPANLTATAAATDTIMLNWTNTSTFDGYNIVVGINTLTPNLAGERDDATSGAASSVTVPVVTLQPGTLHSFKVQTYRRVNGTKVYSAFTNIVSATTLGAAGGGTNQAVGVPIINKSAYPIISLKIDGSEKFPNSPQAIAAGTAQNPVTFTVPSLANGQHSYTAQNGFWDSGSRFTLYSYSGTFSTTNGQSATPITFAAPTIAQLATQFRGTTGLWSGWYTGANGFTPIYIRFKSDSTFVMSYNPNGTTVSIATGTYSMAASGYGGNFVANFSLTITSATAPAQTGTFAAKLSETGGWIGATFLSISPYAIQFNADGP
jgi:N-acetyl-beta-hexosaminidase